MRTLASSFVIAAALLAGCKLLDPTKENPACPDGECRQIDAPPIQCSEAMPCDGNSDTPFCVDGTCAGCIDSAECGTLGDEDRQFCFKDPPGVPRGTCVQCGDDDRQAADIGSATDLCQQVGMQVCDGDTHTCRACGGDGECTSGVCSAEVCIAPGNIAYVAMNGTDNPMCSLAMPCQTVRQALATNRNLIVVAPGDYIDTTTIDIDNRMVTIRATGATISQTGMNREVLKVRGTSQVTVIGGIFDGAGDGTAPVIGQTEAGSALTLDGVTVRNSQSNGITTMTGRLTVRRSTITGNALIGLEVNSAAHPFELTDSNILLNNIAGLRITAQRATVINNVIAKNGVGGTTSAFRVEALALPAMSRIEFNTIANNVPDGTTNGTGVSCGAVSTVLSNSIIYGNTGTNQHNGCAITYSDVQGGATGMGNFDMAPGFVDTATNNFDLNTGSLAAGRANPAADLSGPAAFDHDARPRPRPAGSPADVGAYEIQ